MQIGLWSFEIPKVEEAGDDCEHKGQKTSFPEALRARISASISLSFIPLAHAGRSWKWG